VESAEELLAGQLDDIAAFLWNRSPPQHSRWNRPVIQVRRSLVQALDDTQHAAASLSAALEEAAELPDEAGPLGRDAAVLVICGQALELAKAVRGNPPQDRRRLASMMRRAGQQSRHSYVTEFAQFVGEQTQPGSSPPVTWSGLPTLIRPRPDTGPSLINPDPGWPVLPSVLRQASAAHRDVIALNLEGSGQGAISQFVGADIPEVIQPASVGEPEGRDISHLPIDFADFLLGEPEEDDHPDPPDQPWPAWPADRLNVGVVRADRPGRAVTGGSVAPSTDYLVWVSIGPRDAQAVPGDDEELELSAVANDEVLDVAVFPDSALIVPEAAYTGSFVMGPGRPLWVLHSAERPEVTGAARKTRIYFAIRTPEEPGSHAIRVLLYHRNVLLQTRRLTLPVGDPRGRLSVRTPYTLVRSATASSLQELAPRRLSVYLNDSGDGDHRLCVRGQADGQKLWQGAAGFTDETVSGLIEPVRAGLRKASWGTVNQWDPDLDDYYYPSKQGEERFDVDFSTLQADLFDLAGRGYAVWETMTSGFGSPSETERLRDLMRQPGIVELAPAYRSRLIPPLACLYDIDLDDTLTLSLCPDAKEALQQGTDLAGLACFVTGCPHADLDVVCPSGFWGLRHEITVPPSLDKAADGELRTSVNSLGTCTSLVGTMPENVLAGVTAHAGDVGHLFQEFEHVTSRGDWFSKAHFDRYDVLYFLSHGAEDPKGGGPMIILDAPDKPGIRRKDLRSHNVEFQLSCPLVVLNACDTAALEPDKAVTLVEGFIYYGASAVIGTEITIFTGLAYAFGTKFLDAFVGGASLGAAVRQARLDLLRRWNPLGLAYVAYGLHDVRMVGGAQGRPAA
jgi:hypothetical protein